MPIDRRVFWGLVILAVAARLAAVAVLRPYEVPHSTYEHGEIAANLLAGRGFAVKYLGADGPTSQQAPLYPVAVAGAYRLGGIETPRALLILEVAQSLLGGVLVASTLAWAGVILPGSRRAAPLAGLVAAVDPTLVYAATHVQVVALATALLMASLALGERAARTGRWRDALAAGVALGLLALADPILALAAPAVAWSIARGRGWRSRESARLVGVVAAASLACIAPWVARNYRVHGEFVPIKSSFGYAFWQGNNRLSQGTDKVVRESAARIADRPSGTLREQNLALWEARHEAGYIDDIALSAADYRALGAVSEPERARILFRRALADLRAEPGRYARLCLRRLRSFVLFDETNPKTRSRIYRAAHIGLTVAAALGLLLARPAARRRLGPSVLVVGSIAMFHALTIVSARFHLPIEPILGTWAAAGLTRWGGTGVDADQPRLPTKS